jgi:dipeptidyl aminopeptidase/acylaminoacyl peptidase
METPRRSILGVAAIVCVLGLGELQPVRSHLAGLSAAQPEPNATAQQATTAPGPSAPERFMVSYRGCALLGPDGEEKERLESITSGAGAISPNGRWAAFSKSEPDPPPGKRNGWLVIQSRAHALDQTTVPLIWGSSGSSFLPLWSSDSKRILICEQGYNDDRSRGSAYRVYDLHSKSLTNLKLSSDYWPSDWSADGTRILTSIRTGNGSVRVAWVDVDDTGMPELIGPRLPDDDGRHRRLTVIDLSTKKRTPIGKPGHTHGFCWSSDGSKIAYTWQLPLRNPAEAVERKTYLITCDPDGNNQKTVTMRKYDVPPNSSGKDSVIYFFEVLGWWR